MESSSLSISILHVIISSSMGYETLLDFLHKVSTIATDSIESDYIDHAQTFPPPNHFLILEQIYVYISLSCQIEPTSVFVEDSLAGMFFLLILFSNSKNPTFSSTSKKYLQLLTNREIEIIFSYIQNHIINIKTDRIYCFLLINDVKMTINLPLNLEKFIKMIEIIFDETFQPDQKYSLLMAYRSHPIFNTSKGFALNSNFKPSLLEDKWNFNFIINSIYFFETKSHCDDFPSVVEILKKSPPEPNKTDINIFHIICDYTVYILGKYSENIQIKQQLIMKIISISDNYFLNLYQRFLFPIEYHPTRALLLLFLQILDNDKDLGGLLVETIAEKILKILDIYLGLSKNNSQRDFSVMDKDYQIIISKILLCILYKYANVGFILAPIMDYVINSLDYHIHVCYDQKTLGETPLKIFKEKMIIKSFILSNTQIEEKQKEDEVQSAVDLKNKIIHNGAQNGKCGICGAANIVLSDEVVNYCILALLEYLVHHVNSSFKILLKSVRIVYKFIIYDRNCVSTQVANSEFYSLPPNSIAATAARFYNTLFAKLYPLKLLSQILTVQFHEENLLFISICFSLAIFGSEKKVVELFQTIVEEISKNSVLYIENLSQVVLNFNGLLNAANILLFEEVSNIESARIKALVTIVRSQKNVNPTDSENDQANPPKDTNFKRRLIKSMNIFSQLIIDSSGIFSIPTTIILKYVEVVVLFTGKYCYELESIPRVIKSLFKAKDVEVDRLVEVSMIWYQLCEKPINKLALVMYIIEFMFKSTIKISASQIDACVMRNISTILKSLGGNVFDRAGVNFSESLNFADFTSQWLVNIFPKFCVPFIKDIFNQINGLQGNEENYIFLLIGNKQISRRKKYVVWYIQNISQILCLIISKSQKNSSDPVRNEITDILSSVSILDPKDNKDFSKINSVFNNLRTFSIIMLGSLSHEIKNPADPLNPPVFKNSDLVLISKHIIAIINLSFAYKYLNSTVAMLDNALWFSQILTVYCKFSQTNTNSENKFSSVKFWVKILKILSAKIVFSAGIDISTYNISVELFSLIYEAINVMKLIGVDEISNVIGLINDYKIMFIEICKKTKTFDISLGLIPFFCDRETDNNIVLVDFIKLTIQNLLSRGSGVV